jgi:flagellar hook-associated protein 1 FlgK
MPSLGSILSIARSGMATAEAGIQVASQNISNASTPGYSRKRLSLTPGPQQRLADVIYGTGVRVEDVTRLRDRYLDATFRSETSTQSEQQARSGLLARIEGMLAEPTDRGLANTIDAFYSSFSELASDPSSDTARTLVLEQSRQVASRFGQLATGLDQIRQETEDRVASGVQRANDIVRNVAQLNRRIVADEAAGDTSGDLRDQRDLLVDELAGLADIQVVDRQDGSVGITIDGVAVVDGAFASELEIRLGAGGTLEIAREGVANPIPSIGGALEGLVDVVNRDIPEVRTRIDDLVESFVQSVNTIHNTGANASDTTGIDLFDPAGVTADTIAVAITDAADVVAGTPDGSGAYRAGENDVAIEIAGLRDVALGGIGATAGEVLSSLVSDVASAVRFTRETSEVARGMAEQADTRRQEVSGVSTDEELISLIQYQTAYGAAARVISTADEMLQTLLTM